MNIPLTIQLKKDEIKKMMKRIEKCDARIAGTITSDIHDDDVRPWPGHETEAERKARLLTLVAERMKEIQMLLEGSAG